jgi:hypothetical protein
VATEGQDDRRTNVGAPLGRALTVSVELERHPGGAIAIGQ